MVLNGGNGYTASWTNCNITSGKGWYPGSGQSITYSVSYTSKSGGGSYGIIGYTTNPLTKPTSYVAYLISETQGIIGGLVAGTLEGSFTSDGSSYNIYKAQVNGPSVIPVNSYTLYISVRQTPRTSGTINVQNHINEWANLGLTLLSVQGYELFYTAGWIAGGIDSGSSIVTLTTLPPPALEVTDSVAQSGEITLSIGAIAGIAGGCVALVVIAVVVIIVIVRRRAENEIVV